MARSRRHGALATVIAVLLAITACNGPEPPPTTEQLTIATPPSPSLAPFYVALAEGYFEDAGLDVQVRPQGVGVMAMDALLDGGVDLAAVADPPIARAVLLGEEPLVIAAFDRIDNLTHVVARKDRGVATVADLSGKRVGVIKDNIGEYFLHVYLVTSGIDPESVRITYLEPSEMVAAVVDGHVDAISWVPPSTIKAQEDLGANAAVLERPGLYTVTWSFVTRAAGRDEGGDRLARFLTAIDRANDFIEANPEEAQSITAEGADMPLAIVRGAWHDHQFTLTLDQTLILTLQDVASWMQGAEDAMPSFLPYVDTAPLKSIRPEGVTIVEPEGSQ